MLHTVRRALEFYHDADAWSAIHGNIRKCDFSWSKSAQKYIELYERITVPEERIALDEPENEADGVLEDMPENEPGSVTENMPENETDNVTEHTPDNEPQENASEKKASEESVPFLP